jgi:hypothetical protein
MPGNAPLAIGAKMIRIAAPRRYNPVINEGLNMHPKVDFFSHISAALQKFHL